MCFLTKVEVILLFRINEWIPDEDDSLRVGEVGHWIQEVLQFYYEPLLYLPQFIKIKHLWGDEGPASLHHLAGDRQAGDHQVLEVLQLHAPPLQEVQVEVFAGEGIGLAEDDLPAALIHEETHQSLRSGGNYCSDIFSDWGALHDSRVHDVEGSLL